MQVTEGTRLVHGNWRSYAALLSYYVFLEGIYSLLGINYLLSLARSPRGGIYSLIIGGHTSITFRIVRGGTGDKHLKAFFFNPGTAIHE